MANQKKTRQVNVRLDNWKKLSQIKIDNDFATFDEVITKLLEKYK